MINTESLYTKLLEVYEIAAAINKGAKDFQR